MLRYIYTVLFYIALPFILIRLYLRSRKAPAYRQRLAERFGWIHRPKPNNKPTIWVHAVSVGEVLAAVPFIKQLQQHYPSTRIVVTTMTPTGSARVQAAFEDQVHHVYIPYDLPGAVKRFLNKIKPMVLINMETELWPNIIHACHKRKIPVFIANARLSQKSATTYRYIKPIMVDMLRKITLIAAQTQLDADRYIALGLAPEKAIVTGSIKFDIQFPPSLEEKAANLRQMWGVNRLVWIAASTHEGEEELVLRAFAKLKQKLPQVLLVLVPRHPERFSKVAQLSRKQGYATAVRSDPQSWHENCGVFIGDTMGELPLFYAASDVAFVGGSLVPTGGHNLLEPAALGIPTLTGPHMFNFLEIHRLLSTANAVKEIADWRDLADNVILWLQDSGARTQAGEQGRRVVEQNRGALATHLRLLQEVTQ